MTTEGNIRLHPSSLFFSLGGVARSYLVPAVLVLLFSRGSRADLFFGVVFLPAAAYSIVHYLVFSYRFGVSELVVRGGVLTRYERHVPYSRIQNLDLVQGPLHRMFRVATVRIETASGKEPEAVMNVVSLDAVEELRRRIFRGRDAAEEEEREAVERGLDRELVRLGARDLVVLGLLSNRGLPVVAALWGLSYQFNLDLEERIGRFLHEHARDVTDTWRRLDELGPGGQVVLALGSLVLLVAAMKVLSILWVFFRFQGFRLARAGEDLRLSFGLLTRLSATLPRRRIQVLGVRESLTQRLFGRVEIRAQTAGAAEEKDSAAARAYLAPLAARADLPRLLSEIQPGTHVDGLGWHHVPAIAWRRAIKPRLFFGLALIGVAAWQLDLRLAVLALPLILLVVIATRAWVARLAWATDDERLAIRKGWVDRQVGIVRFSRIQALSLRQSPFDRRWRMATLHVDTAGTGGAGVRLTLPFLPEAEARELFERLHREVSARDFVWN